jgi:hypothetical protein
MDKKVVSPFEFAIAQIADPEAAKKMRSETKEEKEVRLTEKFKNFSNSIKVNRPI